MGWGKNKKVLRLRVNESSSPSLNLDGWSVFRPVSKEKERRGARRLGRWLHGVGHTTHRCRKTKGDGSRGW